MSGIAVYLNTAGMEVCRGSLERMAEATSKRGPDGLRVWHDRQAGMVHAHFWTTPEEVGEEQPLELRQEGLCITADARIDNRDELLRQLGPLDSRTTDAGVILASYRKWGEECTRHMVGDFAFALWDSRQQRLFCARDALGVKQFHYSIRGDMFVGASGIEGVLAGIAAIPAVNRPLIQDLLAGSFQRWVHETAYEGIFRLPPAHQLTLSREGGLALRRYWTIGAQAPIRFRKEADYAESFRELFQDAVKARLRSSGRVGIFVSGGLDSSSVACTAQSIVSASAGQDVHLYSLVFDDTPGADEREYLAAVLEACPSFKHRLIRGDDCWGMREFAGDNGFPMYEPEFSIDRVPMMALGRAARGDDCRVVLAGTYGDQALGSDSYHQAAFLRDVGLGHLISELPHFIRKSRHPAWEVLAIAYARLWVPEGLRSRLRARFRPDSEAPLPYPRRAEPAEDFLPPPGLRDLSAAAVYRNLTSGLHAARMVSYSNMEVHLGIERRFPFLDRRLVDYLLAIPAKIRFKRGWTKYILRQGTSGVLPEKVRCRTTAAVFTALTKKGLYNRERSRVEALLKEAELVREKYVEPLQLSRLQTLYQQDNDSEMRPLIFAICAEAWLRCRVRTDAAPSV